MADQFHRALIELSKHINSETLEDLKYLCQDVVPAAKMEKIKSARDLFQALEECGKISSNNVGYLVDLLEFEGKPQLANKLASFTGTMHQESYIEVIENKFPDVAESQLNVYRQILRTVSNQLALDEVKNLCYISREAEMAGLKHRANLNGSVLFNFLEDNQLISPDNIQYLWERLGTIGRRDLQDLIEQYTKLYLGGYPKPLGRHAPVTEQYYQPTAYNPNYTGNMIRW